MKTPSEQCSIIRRRTVAMLTDDRIRAIMCKQAVVCVPSRPPQENILLDLLKRRFDYGSEQDHQRQLCRSLHCHCSGLTCNQLRDGEAYREGYRYLLRSQRYLHDRCVQKHALPNRIRAITLSGDMRHLLVHSLVGPSLSMCDCATGITYEMPGRVHDAVYVRPDMWVTSSKHALTFWHRAIGEAPAVIRSVGVARIYDLYTSSRYVAGILL